ncbi:MAG: POT family proton-dependent oligopeptide transporter [Bacteroidia bacterium]|jgi:POT family proton-dependent oligopeptide transporter
MTNNTTSVHPRGLYVLFFTEMWERFSYYGMRAIFVLYLAAKATGVNPGVGWEKADALALYGWYTMMVYVLAVPGGIIADRYLGQKKTVLIGGFLLVIGHFILAFDTLEAFYAGCIFIVFGVGALKPNISSMVGSLYKKNDPNRTKGFTLFYIGINIGAFAAPLLVGYVGETINWHYGFGMAGIGMLIGQFVYIRGQKYLKGIGDFVPRVVDPNSGKKAKEPLTKIEKDRMVVLGLTFLIAIVFWGAYEQAGGLMNLFTKSSVNRTLGSFTVPTSWFQSLHAFYVVVIGVPVAFIWNYLRKKGRPSSTIFKMGIGTIIAGLGFIFLAKAAYDASTLTSGQASMLWILAAYLLHVVGELSISPIILNFITKLAPIKYVSMMMGLYFCASGLGNKLAGMVGAAAFKESSPFAIFIGICIFCVFFGLLLVLFVKKLNALTHGADVEIEEAPVESA